MIANLGHARELAGKFRRLNNLTHHGPSIGQYHELILKHYIENFISSRLSVVTGFVRHPTLDKVSPQLDIIIVDENHPFPYLFKEGDLAVVTPESVICAIEVKSQLNRQSFNDIVNKAIGFNESMGGKFAPLFGFCHDGAVERKTLEKWFKDSEHDDVTSNYPTGIFGVKFGALGYVDYPEPEWKGMYHFFSRNEDTKDEENLTLFLKSIFDAISKLNKLDYDKNMLMKEDDEILWHNTVYRFKNPTLYKDHPRLTPG